MTDGNHKPATSKVALQREPEALTIYVPPSGVRGQAAAMLVFSAFWLVFMTGFTTILIVAGALEDEPIMVPLFIGLFWFVGVVLAVCALRLVIGKAMVRIEGGTLYIQKVYLRKGAIRQFALGADAAARLKSAYEVNKRPVYAVAVKTEGGDQTFGTSLSEEEKPWLVNEINDFLGAETVAPPQKQVEFKPTEYRVTGDFRRPMRVKSEADIRPGGRLHVRFPPLRQTMIGRLLFGVAVLIALGWPVCAAYTVWQIAQGGLKGFPPTMGATFMLFPFFIAAIVGLVKLSKRAELAIDRYGIRVRNTMKFARKETERTVTLDRADEAVIKQAGPFRYPSIKLTDGPPVDIYTAVPSGELEWLVAEINDFIRAEQRM